MEYNQIKCRTREEVLNSTVQKGAKYEPTSPKDWKQKKDKSTRVKGLGYVSNSGSLNKLNLRHLFRFLIAAIKNTLICFL